MRYMPILAFQDNHDLLHEEIPDEILHKNARAERKQATGGAIYELCKSPRSAAFLRDGTFADDFDGVACQY